MKKVVENAHQKLLKYYNKFTPLYCIVSALDLHINLEYFWDAEWDEQLIKQWKSKMEDIWKNYKPLNATMILPKKIANEEAFVSSIYKKKQRITPCDELEQ